MMASTTPKTMTAVVIHEAGGPEALKIQQWPIPTPKEGEVLIKVKAFGLNRSEMYTRQGHSPVAFPRILGIECVGTVSSCPSHEFPSDAVVATAMGGMGRAFDGGYAEYTCVPVSQVQILPSPSPSIPWEILGALPEMMQTAYGSLFKALRLEKGDSLLIRGGTTSVGLAALALARDLGCVDVGVTTRKEGRVEMLKGFGVRDVFVDVGSIQEEVRKRRPEGYSKCLELVGTKTLADSLKCVADNGIVCVTGIAGGEWILPPTNPQELIPTSVCLTIYSGGTKEFLTTPLSTLAQKVVEGKLKIPIKTFKLSEIMEAHRHMEESTASAKIVVVV